MQTFHQVEGARHRTRARRKLPWQVVLIALVAFVGVTLLLLPKAAGWLSQSIYSAEIRGLTERVTYTEPSTLQEAIDQAHLYNSKLIGSVVVEADKNVPTSHEQVSFGDYNTLLQADPRGLMARLQIPAIHVDLPVYHGTSDRVLEMGVGHLQGSALPVGGVNTHSVLTAHRGLATAELFNDLDQLQIGDLFTIEVFGEVLSYQVFDTRVVEPWDTETLYPQLGRDLVTLITCTPLGVNTHRILVTAERVLPTPPQALEQAGERPEVPGFPWWAVWYLGALAIIGLYVSAYFRPAPLDKQIRKD